MNKVLVLAVHPDDETLGCGGTLLKHKARGDMIHWLIATDINEECGFSQERVLERAHEIQKVKDAYNFNGVYKLEIPAMKVNEFPIHKIIQKISKIFNEVQPNILYLPFKKDIHSDHKLIFEAAYSCTKTFRYPFIQKILMMETISETEFSPVFEDHIFMPNYFVDISGFLDKKIEIMKIYEKECGQHPFPRNIENIRALATFRGGTAGYRYAEAFMILRDIWGK